VDPARARIKQPKSRPHVVRTKMETIEVSTGNIVEFGTVKKSTEAIIDAALAELVDGEARWAELPLSGRASLLKQVLTLMTAHADEWVATAAAIKGLDAKSPLMGEEWTSVPTQSWLHAPHCLQRLKSSQLGKAPLPTSNSALRPVTARLLPVPL
jgi:aldehyde dehydrogenase (NAD(P)+)